MREKVREFRDSNMQVDIIAEDDRQVKYIISEQNSPEFEAKTVGNRNQRSMIPAVSNLTTGIKNLKYDKLKKMMSVISLNCYISCVTAWKKLIESVWKWTYRLSHLNYGTELREKLVEDVSQEPFLPLAKEDELEVERAFSAEQNEVLVTHRNSTIEITGQIFQCLKPGAWLNDEVINLYLELLKERENRAPHKFLKCHFFNSFFYKKIFVPIHQEIHWSLAIINKKDEKLQYLDSLKEIDSRVLKILARYFVDEVRDKSGKDLNLTSWKEEYVDDLPAQKNSYDCGMFILKYADLYSRGLGLCFNQEHMAYFRLRTAKEILQLRAD